MIIAVFRLDDSVMITRVSPTTSGPELVQASGSSLAERPGLAVSDAGGHWRRWRSGIAAAIATARGSRCPGAGAVAFRSAGRGAYGVMFWLMWKRLPGS